MHFSDRLFQRKRRSMSPAGNYAEKLSLKDFIPSTCHECKLQQHPVCGFRKDVNETLFRYFGSIYRENETD